MLLHYKAECELPQTKAMAEVAGTRWRMTPTTQKRKSSAHMRETLVKGGQLTDKHTQLPNSYTDEAVSTS